MITYTPANLRLPGERRTPREYSRPVQAFYDVGTKDEKGDNDRASRRNEDGACRYVFGFLGKWMKFRRRHVRNSRAVFSASAVQTDIIAITNQQKPLAES